MKVYTSVRTRLFATSLLVAAAGLTACGSATEGSASDACLIGGAPPLTGDAAIFGEQTTSGADLAAKYANEHPDEFAKVRTDYRDGKNLPGPNVQAVKAFSADDATAMLIQGSGPLVAAEPVATQEELILFNVAATTSKQRSMSDYVFANTLLADAQIDRILDDASNILGVEKIGVIMDDNELGKSLLAEVKDSVEQYGISFDTDDVAAVTPGETDFRTDLQPLVGKEFDAILVLGTGTAPGIAVRQASELGIDPEYFIGERNAWNPDSIKAAGDAIEGALALGFNVTAKSNEMAAHLFKVYESKYGTPPSQVSMSAFDGVLSLAHAAKMAGSCDADAVAASMREIDDFQGVTGTLDYSDRLAQPEVVWTVVRDGAKEPVKLDELSQQR